MGPQLGGPEGEKTESISKEEALPNIQAEWDFTEEKINDNFSNFSAFHYRRQLFALLNPSLEHEFELTANAMCTEPDDQTAWWYQSFLLEASNEDELTHLLPDHVRLLRELQQETESKSKWVLLGLLQCLGKQPDTVDERRALLKTLIEIDADRAQRYHDLIDSL